MDITAAPSWDRTVAVLPAAAARGAELDRAVMTTGAVDPVTLELCRLRVARVLGCGAELRVRSPEALAAGFTEDLAEGLAAYGTDPRYRGERAAAVTLAEQYVLDPHGLTDATFAELGAHVGPAGVAAVVLAVATFDARCRARLALAIGEEP